VAVQPQLLRAVVDASTGGQLTTDRLSLEVPAGAVGSGGGEVNVLQIDPAVVPALPPGFSIPSSAFVITLTDSASGSQLAQPATPLALHYQLSSTELNAADGNSSRLKIAAWIDDSWVPVGCAAHGSSLDCALAHLSLFAVILPPPPAAQVEMPLPNGWFAQQANGFDGAGDLGFGVIDDADASLWSEFQRLGGVSRFGYPISRRFDYNGRVTQAFQRGILQWQAESGTAVVLNTFDELSARGLDSWLDTMLQVPPPAPGTPDPSALNAAPAIADFYAADPQATTVYGQPMAVKDYGTFVAARFQAAILQLWTADGGAAPVGSVTVGSVGDIAKDAGLIPASALVPQHMPAPASAAPPAVDTPSTEPALDPDSAEGSESGV
jgi:hypothetical protein